MFKDFIFEARLHKQLSIRAFCRLTGEDASNWSKIERGVMKPPTNTERLHKIAEVLQMPIGSEDYEKMVDLADIDSGRIPEYIQEDRNILECLPAFFRVVDKVKPTREDFDRLIGSLKETI